MTKREFLLTLEKALYFLDPAERRDILNDYEEHFRNELAEGKNEYQIASDLGNPVDIAMQYKPEQAPGETRPAERIQPVIKRQAPPPYNPPVFLSARTAENRVDPFAGGAAPEPGRVDPFASNIPPADNIFSAPRDNRDYSAGSQTVCQQSASEPKKRKGFLYFVGKTISTFLYVICMLVVASLAVALVAAGWAVVFAGAVAGLVEGISAFFVYANFGLMIGVFLAGVGVAMLCVALGFLMVKGTIGLFKLAKKIIMKPINLLKEVFA